VSKKRYIVELSADERKRLEELIRKGKSPAKNQLKARIFLRADESPLGPNWNDPKISEALGTYPMTCARVRQQFARGGIDAVLNRKQRATPPVSRIFDGEKEARLNARISVTRPFRSVARATSAPIAGTNSCAVPR
jgi:hypothetical protein